MKFVFSACKRTLKAAFYYFENSYPENRDALIFRKALKFNIQGHTKLTCFLR
jgi:hypothetical protein